MKNIGFANTFHQRNQIGLDSAYKSDNKISIKDDTMFVGGTSNLQDVWDDLKIPFGLTKYSQRYQDADNLLKKNPQVNKITGTSLGGAVSLELQKQHPNRNFEITTYGAPVLQMGGQKYKRFRHAGDFISGLDDGAITYKGSINPIEAHKDTGFTN
jgi:uncharacterized protein YhjY with autotransporter beta-barrel domain